jgi:hypothetical protein
MYFSPSNVNTFWVLLFIGTYLLSLIIIIWVGLFGLATLGYTFFGLSATYSLKTGYKAFGTADIGI